MYALRNKVQLIGRLGGKPEVKEMEGGKKMVSFSLATSETHRGTNGEKIHDTQWHRIVAWGKMAEIIEKYLDKGREIALEGRLINRAFQDKDGSKRFVTEVQINELLMLGVKQPQQ